MKNIAVIGCGVSGLSMAHYLLKYLKNVNISLIGPSIGGVIKT